MGRQQKVLVEDDPEVSAVFRSSFPEVENTGFRSGAWKLGIARTAEELKPLHPTMLHALASASKVGGATGITFVPENEDAPETHHTYREIYALSRHVADAFTQRGVKRGDRVLIVLPTCLEFVATFFAIERVGAIPVPSYPPAALEKVETALERLGHIGNHSGSTWIVTNRKLLPLLGELAFSVKSVRHLIAVESVLEADAPRSTTAVAAPKDPAFIQYTSGSTGNPKGVLLSHRNITSNIHAIGQAVRISRKDVVVSWLPLYHDMGLIGALLFAVYWRVPFVLMSPTTFLMRPSRWLWAIHKHKGTLSPAPNFAYGLCVKRVRPSDREGLDLSSWRYALNGAEPVNLRTARDFLETFASHGFRAESMLPVYGLAESSLAVTTPPPGELLKHEVVNRDQLAAGQVRQAKGVGSTAVVCVGKPVPGHEVLIVDADGNKVEPGQVGHIIVRGPSVMHGYYKDKEATAKVIRGGWLWTGDLGYQTEDGLYVTGRAKDMIKVRGRNYYAEDVERVAERVPGVRSGGVVAFGLYDEEKAIEQSVIVCEVRIDDVGERKKLAEKVTESVAMHCGMPVEEVVLVPPGTIPKTSSGKRQRALTRQRYLEDALVPTRTGKLKLAVVFARSGAGLLKLLRKRKEHRREPD
ncbi:MAG: fatty acyl-AMP ligase [Myxococcaceae bacterium]